MAITFTGWKEQKNADGEEIGKRGKKTLFTKEFLQYFVEQSSKFTKQLNMWVPDLLRV